MANFINLSTVNREKLLTEILELISIYDLRAPIPAWVESLERYTRDKGCGYMTALSRAKSLTKKPEWYKAFDRWYLDLREKGINRTVLRTENVTRDEMEEIAEEDEASGL